jgi:hypothetical protein
MHAHALPAKRLRRNLINKPSKRESEENDNLSDKVSCGDTTSCCVQNETKEE